MPQARYQARRGARVRSASCQVPPNTVFAREITASWDQVTLPAAETQRTVSTHVTRPRRLTPAIGQPHVPPASGAVRHPVGEYPKTESPGTFAVFDALTDIVCVTTCDGTLRFLNRAGRELLGYVGSDDALVGSLFPTHTPAARELLLDEVIPAALRDGTITCDTALQTADGRVFPASQTVVVTPNAVGLPLTLTLVIRNVGIERHQAASLGESQRLFEMIARASPDLICLYDPIAERVVWMNRCVHAFLGGTECDARTLSRREMHRLVHPIDRARFRAKGARMAEAYSDSDTLASEMRVRTTGGEWRWLHTRATVFSRRETGAPLLLLGVVTDITARKKTEQQLCAERDTAEYATLAKNEFLSRISEEFRGTLHSMLGIAAEVRADREHRLTARDLGQLAELITSGTALLGTISDLHDYTQIEAGEMAVAQTLTDVREVMRASVDAFCDHPLRTRGAIALMLPDTAAPVLTDPSRLRQALSHLVASALSQSIDGLVSITMRVDADQRPLAIDVQHGGVPTDGARSESVFTPFEPTEHRASPSIRAGAGSGLGLALARAMCEMIGCSLSVARVESEHGATFRIGLPVPSRAAQLAAEFLVPNTPAVIGNADRRQDVVSSV